MDLLVAAARLLGSARCGVMLGWRWMQKKMKQRRRQACTAVQQRAESCSRMQQQLQWQQQQQQLSSFGSTSLGRMTGSSSSSSSSHTRVTTWGQHLLLPATPVRVRLGRALWCCLWPCGTTLPLRVLWRCTS